MKKICLHIVFLFVSFSISAQSYIQWPESNAEWHYDLNFQAAYLGYHHSYLGVDTIIQNKVCKRILTDIQLRYNFSTTNSPVQRKPDQFFYQSNDSVYLFNEITNQFNLSFKLTGSIGDIWDLGKPSTLNIDLNSYVRIVDITEENYNGKILKNFHLRPCLQNGDTLIYPISSEGIDTICISYLSKVNERIGPMNPFMTLTPSWTNYSVSEEMDQPLWCYSSDSIGFYKISPNIDCYAGFVSINENYLSRLNVFPNPAHNQLNIELKNFEMLSNIEVFNALGQCALVTFEYHPQMITLNTQSLCNGFYLLKLNYKNGQSQLGKFQILK